MTTLEKLIRAFEALKVVQLPSNVSDETVVRRREKTTHCITIADAMCTANMKNTQEFSHLLSISIETLLLLCNDPDSDIRMVADESLNRIIRALMDNNIGKIQLELHKEIKKNGSARSLRAALWRFAELCHMIRPQKGKPYIQSLIPYIEKMAKREEESVLETLATAVERIFQYLGIFASDSEVKTLLRAFFQNLSSNSAVIRRASAASIISICVHCKKPETFINWSLATVLESLLPIQEEYDNACSILGALGVLRSLIPHINSPLSNNKQQQEGDTMRGSFGRTKSARHSRSDESLASIDHLIQIYELSLHFALHQDHNVVNAALECLQQLLRSPSPELVSVFLSPGGIGRSYIISTEEQNMLHFKHRALSQLSVSHSIMSDDAAILLDDSLPEPQRTKPTLQVVGESQTSLDSLLNVPLQARSASIGDSIQSPDDTLESPLHISRMAEAADIEGEIEEDDAHWSPQEDEESIATPSSPNANCSPCNIGSFCDADVPLSYCCRLLVNKFLLTGQPGGLRRDGEVRVSVKALALGCIAGVVSLWPDAFILSVDKQNNEKQLVSDVLCFAAHPDPQLRGCTSLLAGSLIKTVLVLHGNTFSSWANKNNLTISAILDPLHQGLKGDSSVTCRQTLTTMQGFLGSLLESQDALHAIPLISEAINLHNNPYWLVKVRLVELLADLKYISMAHATNSSALQHQVLHTVLVPLLADEDSRVRHASTLSLVKIIPHLFFQTDELCQDPVTAEAIKLSGKLLMSAVQIQRGLDSTSSSYQSSSILQPLANNEHVAVSIEGTLSRVLYVLSNSLLTSTTKHLIFGCCEALAELSKTYPATLYPRAWNCLYAPKSIKKPTLKRVASECKVGEEASPASGLLTLVISLMTSSPISLDLNCQQYLLILAGNIFSGIASCCLQEDSVTYLEEASVNPKAAWSFMKDKKLAHAAEDILKHAVRVLAMFAHVLDETVPVLVNPKPVLPQSLSSIPSPIKRKSKASAGDATPATDKPAADEKSDDKKSNSRSQAFGYFMNIPHCLRIYELMKSAYSNYKLTLDFQASEKFLVLLHTTLNVLSQLLEIATLTEIGRSAEELLGYLKVTASVEPVATIICVQQLLKSLFGTNFGAQSQEVLENKRKPCFGLTSPLATSGGFYDYCYQIPYKELNMMFEERRKIGSKLLSDNAWPQHQRESKSPLVKKKDHAALASYIKLFEPMVIKALEQYTITSDVHLQCKVLQLLSQLVQLRVNYCLLDSDKIFIGFVLKQFELIEKGHILYTEQLIPQIFYFLVHLSYEKNHSKAIIGIPEVIQLCDGLMASGQPPVTHCIPALIPVVEDVFMMRGGATSGSNVAELDTQREVLVAVLLRLVEYHQVLELLSMILRQSYSDKERWNRWSRKVADTLLPLLAHGQVRLECRTSQTCLISLLDSLAPAASELVVPILNVLFSEPPSTEDPEYNVAIQRWFGAILGVLSHLLVHSSEDEVLEQLALHNLEVPQTSFIDQDPLNVTRLQRSSSPDIVLTRLIFQLIEIVTNQICKVVICPVGATYEADYLKEQIAHFLLYCIYMLESGSYRKVATATMLLVQKTNICSEDDQLHVENINKMFLWLAPFCPLLTFLWCYMLILIGHNSLKFWAQALYTGCTGAWNSMIKRNLKAMSDSMKPAFCCNLEIVRRGAVILFSDFVCDNLSDLDQLSWLLMHHIEDIVHLSKEIPVQELITAIHRSPHASNLLVQAIASKCQELTQPSTVALLLQQCLEGIHPDQTGAVLQLLASRFLNLPQLALSRQARALASKRAEMLLLSSSSEVLAQLSKEDLQQLLGLIGNRYFDVQQLAWSPSHQNAMTNVAAVHQNTATDYGKPSQLLRFDELRSNELLHFDDLATKHEGLRNVLRKIGTEFYKLPPDDASHNFDPTLVKSINVDGAWFLTQIKHKCCHPDASGTNLSIMLSDLSLKDILCVMSSPKFNLAILEECIKHGRNLSLNKGITSDSVSPLFEAAQATLLHRIKRIESFLPRPHQVVQPVGRNASAKEQKFSQRLIVSLADHVFLHSLIQLAGVVPIYFESLARLNLCSHLSSEHQADFAKFAVLCLEVAHWQIKATDIALNPGALEATLTCAAAVLSHPNIANELGLPGTYTWLASACNAIFAMTTFMLQSETLPIPFQANDLTNVNEDSENFCIIQACPQISTLIFWLEKCGQRADLLLQSLYEPIKKVIIGLARLSPLNSYAATPPEVWHHGWDVSLEGPSATLVPPLPVEMLLETEILEQFIYRLTLLGWTSRQQFEENWMALLGVLNSNQDEETMSSEEASAMLQASGLAVKGITALLVQSLLLPTPGNPIASKILHQPRELPPVVQSEMEKQMRRIHNLLVQQAQDSQMTSTCSWQFDDVFHRPNLERVGLNSVYGYSQISLQYLLRVIKVSEDQNVSKPAPYLQREQCLIANGIDVHSCLHFLLDLYTQWTQPQAQTPLLLLLECVRSVLMISEIFTERAQFQWMLHTFIELWKSHHVEDELLHQFLTLGVCKAYAVLSQEEADVLEKVRKMTDNSLRSGFLPSRLCGLHGVLHLLQSSRCLSQTPADDTLQLAIDYIQRHMDLASGSSNHSERHLLALWALIFFLLEAEQVTESEMAPAVLQLALALVSSGNQVISLNSALTQGLEKLILCGTARGHVGDQVTKVALEKLKHPNHMNFLPGFQLLLTCMYTGKSNPGQSGEENKDEINLSDADPEILLQSLEKTSALFDRIKKGYPHEVELICGVLPTLLSDFFPPSEMLTKVIGEFLSQQQSHPRLLAGVVSQLFERACSEKQLPLIQDWLVLSLSNFTQCSPVGMAVWCLTCFFVSASSNYWLRAMFPHIQSRIGRCEVEDRQLLCLAAWDFYQKLSESQKQDFVAAIQGTTDAHSPILNIISCL